MSRLNTFLKRGAAIVFAAVLFGIAVIFTFEEFINEYQTGTIVGNIDLSGKKKSDVNYDIVLGVNDYITEYYISVEFNNTSYVLSSDVVSANIGETVNSISNGKRTPVFYDINVVLLEAELKDQINPEFIELVDMEALKSTIARSLLDNDPFSNIYLHDYIESFEVLWEELNTYTYYDISGQDVLDNIESGSFRIMANSRFNYSDYIHELFLNSKELSILATGIQAITIDTNFEAFSKSNHQSPSNDENNDYDYYDTYINLAQGKDFSFFNPFNFEYEIQYTKVGNQLIFKLIGIPFEENYIHKVVKTDIPYLTITNGVVSSTGRDGVSYEIVRYIDRNGVQLLDKSLYTNYYAPVHQVTEIGG